jgi:16S rRNA (cytosine967-C5)-methyltransferase
VSTEQNYPVFSLIERVLRAADREHPADDVLRLELKSRRDLEPGEATELSRAVFAYFRWRNWLNSGESLSSQIDRALELSDRFANAPEEFPDEELIARAVPGWLKDEMEISASWARSLQAEPKLWLRAQRGQGRALAARLGECRVFGEGRLEDTLEYFGPQDLFRTPEFHRGEFELQDVSSQAVGLICDPQPGETWWDACAGEGGKMLHLSALMENRGLIWASDRAAWRLQRLKRRAARAKVFNYRSVLWDGGPKLPTKTKFDGVLVDAPCSGTGTWHRNPHARWTVTAQDVKELSAVQQDVLLHAAASVKPGGKLVYAVCTLTRPETLTVVEALEKQIPEFERLTVANPLLSGAPAGREIWLWPKECGGNGMFVAVWRRKA